MIKVAVIAAAALFSINAMAQTTGAEVEKTKRNFFSLNQNQYKKPSKDYVMLQVGFNDWLIPTSSNALIRKRGHEINAYICYDLPFKQANFSFATGAGIASSNVYLKDQTLSLVDTSTQAYFKTDSANHKRFKLSLNYVEVPLEFRFYANKYNRNRGFKASLGVRVGALIQAHTKGVRTSGAGNLKDKEISRRFFETWRIAPTVRAGYGNFSIYGTYQITEVFKAGNVNGLGINPYSVGLCISGL